MDKSLDQAKKIKLNVSNIRSVLIKGNKDQKEINLRKERLSAKQKSKEKFKEKEKKLESPIKSSLNKVKESVGSPAGGSIFDKLLEFLGLTLLGIIVNAAPIIIEKVEEILDIVVEVFTPIQSTFNLIVGFMSGEIDDPKYDADKKRVDGEIEKLNKPGGKVDKLISKTGLLEPYIRKFTKALNMGSKGVVLAKQGGMEGFKDTKTGKFTKRQWTTSERKSYNDAKIQKKSETSSKTSSDKTATPVTSLGSGGGSLKDMTDQDYSDLAFVVSHEALRNTDDEYGVAAAVLNRVADSRYPSTIMKVGTAPGQFEAVFTGKAYRDEKLAKKLKHNQGKIVEALMKLNGRTDFKAVSSMGQYMGDTDVMFHNKGNFYHYAEQRTKRDPIPSNIPQEWKKFVGGSSKVATGEGGSLSMFTQVRPDERRMSAVNQPMYEDLNDEEEIVNVYIQPINNVRTVYNYQPIPQRSYRMKSTPSPKLSGIWGE